MDDSLNLTVDYENQNGQLDSARASGPSLAATTEDDIQQLDESDNDSVNDYNDRDNQIKDTYNNIKEIQYDTETVATADTGDSEQGVKNAFRHQYRREQEFQVVEEQKREQPSQAEYRETCLYCFDINRGMKLLVQFQILTALFALYQFIIKMILNPFKDDGRIHAFFWLIAISNLPRIYGAYLCYQWLRIDNMKTRNGLVTAFLIWFVVELFLMFDKLIFNYALFGSTYPGYIYKKRFELGPDDLHGLHQVRGPKIEYDDMMEAIRFVESLKSFSRLFLWMPLKLYFYTIAVKFGQQLTMMNSGSIENTNAARIVAYEEQEQESKDETELSEMSENGV